MMDRAFEKKIQRLAEGGAPRVLDVFAGCGGVSLGFKRAGFVPVAGIEADPQAAISYARNIHGESADRRYARARDMRDDPETVLSDIGVNQIASAIDVMVGGPPCQAYARVGRAKLRDVYEHPEAFRIDPRANLYLRFLEYVRRLKPLAVVMENVPDILNFGGHNVAEEICEVLKSEGFDAGYTVLNAVHYGVPQVRDRAFVIAFRRELRIDVSKAFPRPTHRHALPSGYVGSRSVALKVVMDDLFTRSSLIRLPTADPGLPAAVTVQQALGDLPELNWRTIRPGARTLDRTDAYRPVRASAYASMMRNWPDLGVPEHVVDHVTRYLPRDPPIFRRMKPGSEYPAAHAIAMQLFEKKCAAVRRAGGRLTSARKADLMAETVPPYPVDKFPNKWWKLDAGRPSRTLMAHIGKDTYSHIHYDSRQARVITVREAARLQSFPDAFRFEGAMNAAFRQIGNAVPPLLAWRIAERIGEALAQSITNRARLTSAA